MSAAAVRTVDLRYAGQGYELTVDWGDDFAERFHREHERRYGYADRGRAVEVVNVRVHAVARTEQQEAQRLPVGHGDGRQAAVATKPMCFEGQQLTGTVYRREKLQAGDTLAGPAVITEYSATTFLPPHCTLHVDALLNLVIDVAIS